MYWYRLQIKWDYMKFVPLYELQRFLAPQVQWSFSLFFQRRVFLREEVLLFKGLSSYTEITSRINRTSSQQACPTGKHSPESRAIPNYIIASQLTPLATRHIATDDGMMYDWWIGKHSEGCGADILQVQYWHFCGGTEEYQECPYQNRLRPRSERSINFPRKLSRLTILGQSVSSRRLI
jgi:hypothetical protein